MQLYRRFCCAWPEPYPHSADVRPEGGRAPPPSDAAVKMHYIAKLQGHITRAQNHIIGQGLIMQGRLSMRGRLVIVLKLNIFSSCQDRQRTLKTAVFWIALEMST